MTKHIYTKRDGKLPRKIIRYFGLAMFFVGLVSLAYFALPLISWQIYLEPVFASQNLAVPIPKTTFLTSPSAISSLLRATADTLQGIDYSNAANWFPTYKQPAAKTPVRVSYYYLSIPKLHVNNAIVSTVDNDLNLHLVNYSGTAIPPNRGNAVLFGHSTLPQLFDPSNYKTILAYAHTLQIGDTLVVNSDNVLYTYKIFQISIIDPDDISALTQSYDDSYLTLVTCTPPGTTWKRLIIQSRLEKI